VFQQTCTVGEHKSALFLLYPPIDQILSLKAPLPVCNVTGHGENMFALYDARFSRILGNPIDPMA
jgi:hypothetical protein